MGNLVVAEAGVRGESEQSSRQRLQMQSLHGREEAERAEKTEKGVALHVEQLHSLLVSGRVFDRLSSSTGQLQKISLFFLQFIFFDDFLI